MTPALEHFAAARQQEILRSVHDRHRDSRTLRRVEARTAGRRLPNLRTRLSAAIRARMFSIANGDRTRLALSKESI